MPSFFTDNLGFDLESAGILCVFPYLALFISSLSFGVGFEYLQNNYGWSVDNVRQVAQYISYAGSSSGLIICSFMDNKYAAYVFMIMTQVRSLLLCVRSVSLFLSCPYLSSYFCPLSPI
jgi:hypothetical protein